VAVPADIERSMGLTIPNGLREPSWRIAGQASLLFSYVRILATAQWADAWPPRPCPALPIPCFSCALSSLSEDLALEKPRCVRPGQVDDSSGLELTSVVGPWGHDLEDVTFWFVWERFGIVLALGQPV
jgi:hypothetical protein